MIACIFDIHCIFYESKIDSRNINYTIGQMDQVDKLTIAALAGIFVVYITTLICMARMNSPRILVDTSRDTMDSNDSYLEKYDNELVV